VLIGLVSRRDTDANWKQMNYAAEGSTSKKFQSGVEMKGHTNNLSFHEGDRVTMTADFAARTLTFKTTNPSTDRQQEEALFRNIAIGRIYYLAVCIYGYYVGDCVQICDSKWL